MIPAVEMDTKIPTPLYTLEFFTLDRGNLTRKEDAEREWFATQGRALGPVPKAWAVDRLRDLLGAFQDQGRVPRWVQFHPEIPPALVGNTASGRQVVIQLRECFDL